MQIKFRLIRFLFICILAGGQYVHGQNLPEKPKDTLIVRKAYIELGDIPISSAEIKIKARKDIKDMVPEGS